MHVQIQKVCPRGMRGFLLVYGGELRFPKTAGAPAFAEALKLPICSKPPLAQDKHPAPGQCGSSFGLQIGVQACTKISEGWRFPEDADRLRHAVSLWRATRKRNGMLRARQPEILSPGRPHQAPDKPLPIAIAAVASLCTKDSKHSLDAHALWNVVLLFRSVGQEAYTR